MGQLNSVAFAQSPSVCGEESGWFEGLGRASCRDVWVGGHWGNGPGLVLISYLTHHWVMTYGHLQGPQGGKIQLASQGYAHGPVDLL